MPTKPPSKAFRSFANEFAKKRAAAGGAGAPVNKKKPPVRASSSGRTKRA